MSRQVWGSPLHHEKQNYSIRSHQNDNVTESAKTVDVAAGKEVTVVAVIAAVVVVVIAVVWWW